MAKGKGPNVLVVKASPTKYVVKEAGNPKPLTRPATQEASIKKAIPIAKANQSELLVQGRDAKFRSKDSYGNDSNPPKDREH
jgi:hypothetical protein